MVTFESRIIELEDGQQALIMADTSEVKSLTPDDMIELRVLRRNEEEAVYLQIGARMYRLSFEDNALIEENPAMLTEADDAELPMGDDLMELEEEEEPAWYEVYWWIAPLVGVIAALAFVAMRFLKRPSDEEDDEEEGAAAGMNGGFPEADGTEDLDDMEDFPEPEEIPEPEEVEAVEPE